MYLPTLTGAKKTTERTITWAGLNRNTLIDDNELSACSNLSTKHFPLISPRPSRENTDTLSGTPRALFSTNELAWVDGTSFYYDGEEKITGLAAGTKSIVDFQDKILIFPDKKYYDYANNTSGTIQGYIPFIEGTYDSSGIFQASTTDIATFYPIELNAPGGTVNYTLTHDRTGITTGKIFYYDASFKFISSASLTFSNVGGVMTEEIAVSGLPSGYKWANIYLDSTDLTLKFQISETVYPSAGKVPDIDFSTVWSGRVWGVKGTEIYACALGNVNDWTTFIDETGAVDESGAWQYKELYTNGNFTGITTYANHVIYFKRNHVYEQYGDVPSNFNPVEVSKTGCIDNRSIFEVNSQLYFLGADGVYIFTGGKPNLVSYNLNEQYVSGVAGGDSRRYYISLYNGTAYKLYVYDTWHNIWLQEDTFQAVGFTYLNGFLYALNADKKLYKFNSGAESVTSYFESKVFTENLMEKKKQSKINIRADLESGSTMSIYINYDNGDYQLIKSYSQRDLRSVRIPLKIQRCDHFQIKLQFTGEYVLHELTRTLSIGSDK